MDIKYTTLKDALIAVSSNGLDIKYCSPELVSNIEILKAAIYQNYFALKEIKNIINPYTNKLVICDKELMLQLIKENVKVFRDTGSDLKNDKEVVLYVVKKDGSLLKEANERIQNDKEVLLTALSNSIFSISGARIHEELKNDKEVALKVLRYRNNRLNMTWLGNDLKNEIKEALGYDILKDPNNSTIIGHVENYLRCKLSGKEFTKPENPFNKKEEPKIEVKEDKKEIKEETKIEKKEESKAEKIIAKPKVKEEKTSEKEVKTVNIEKELNELNAIRELIQKNIIKTDELQKEINSVKKQNEELLEKLNQHANNIKKYVLEMKK